MAARRPGLILVVDDDAETRSLLCALLLGVGYDVEEATNGEEALASIARRPPDLMLLDMVMPGLNGWGVIRRMPPGGPPILIISGEYLSPTAFGLQGHGIAGYLVKPFSGKNVVETCRQVLDPLSTPRTPALPDRRIEERVMLDVPVSLVQADRRPLAVGRALDLSLHGLRLRLGTNLAPGQTVRLVLDLPDGQGSLYVQGEARWSRHGEAGITLSAADAPTQQRIRDYIDRQTGRPRFRV